ncbi:MAG: glycosyl transferase [Firmicutes bacterium HGW-Firmicutes-11]|jgi:glycosyltransferase involved in cell wall biosynthesis|nr:MAG: glycosyl transferase [Firmicutes bacterium HGW-Firmicutes-11]
MMSNLTVGIFNDSFPPTIDGVANTTVNYAKEIQKSHGNVIVATPWYPRVVDDYPFEVIRYPSVYVNRKLGYRAGNPLDPLVLNRLIKAEMDIIHTHSPFMSTILARSVRFSSSAPVILTYHTKFDIEFRRVLPFNHFRSASMRILVANINTCDEVWVVSEGAGENLRSLGYEGDYIVMDNGTDFPKGRSSQSEIDRLAKQYDIEPGTPVFLFVGRMMWYKGTRLILDGLRIAKSKGYNFRMFFVGDGYDKPEIEAYMKECGLEEECVFTGAIYDRELLRVYFCLADLFLFPSTFDTNGIAVTEAAACSCPSLLIQGSCAAERAVHEQNALLIREDAEDLANTVMFACDNRMFIRKLGDAAGDSLYLSWADAVAKAVERYRGILTAQIERKDPVSARLALLSEIQQLKEDLVQRKDIFVTRYREREIRIIKDMLDQLMK